MLDVDDENDNEEYLAVLSMLHDRRAVSLSDEGDFLSSMYMLEESGGGGFNGGISEWDVTTTTAAAFNGGISEWDVTTTALQP